MKRLILILTAALAFSIGASAQQPDYEGKIKYHAEQIANTFQNYIQTETEQAEAKFEAACEKFGEYFGELIINNAGVFEKAITKFAEEMQKELCKIGFAMEEAQEMATSFIEEIAEELTKQLSGLLEELEELQ